ncbi:MAG: TIGR03960 family B12-binding radical SAM protein [Candidatus Cloacimonetes bacterium]|nr:TIGR03960 family B12-binding radical SAM protein [Candidatus Cloacimonadota bacterium]
MNSIKNSYNKVAFSEILPAVNKPSRYINREINSYHKQPHPEKVNFCLAFPDLYEVGFSHLGLKILYSILNKESDSTADRVYAPWVDFATKLKEKRIPLYSLENGIALHDFDVIGFTLQSELTYTNILMMLDLAKIPLRTIERNESHPLIIAGGLGAANPEPLAPFFDAFFIGEAEEGIIEIKNVLLSAKKEKFSREKTLKLLQELEGVYVPALYKKVAQTVMPITGNYPEKVKVRKYLDFEIGKTYTDQLVSWQQATHDRYIAEIMRGCSRGCRFCFAGFFYRPVRERKVEDIVDQLLKEVKQQGWEEAALLSLSSADYSCIKPLLIELYSELHQSETDLSLPSLRADSIDDNILKLMNSLKQNGITIAPEAGSQRLRNIINKDISEEQILELVKLAVANKWKILKLYFMIGLPWETDDDIAEIGVLIDRIMTISEKKLNVNITISPFIPKPHTPFQWAEMPSQEVLLNRIFQIKNRLNRYKRIKIKYHDVDSSFLECILNRGNREVGELIYQAYKNGACFDGWNECFDFSVWIKSADQLDIDLNQFRKGLTLDQELPWEHIDTGIDKEFLRSEYHKAQQGSITEDCRTSSCSECGICTQDIKPSYAVYYRNPELILNKPLRENKPGFKYRIKYSKTGLLRFVSHLDTLRMLHRLLRMTGLPIVYTQGYNIHPKIHFGPPLPVGVEGKNEVFDFELEKPLKNSDILQAFLKTPIKDWEWLNVYQPDLDELPKLDDYTYEKIKVSFHANELAYFTNKLTEYESKTNCYFSKERKGKIRELDLKELITGILITNNCLNIEKRIAGASVFDILLSVFSIDREDTGKYDIVRETIMTEKELKS